MSILMRGWSLKSWAAMKTNSEVAQFCLLSWCPMMLQRLCKEGQVKEEKVKFGVHPSKRIAKLVKGTLTGLPGGYAITRHHELH